MRRALPLLLLLLPGLTGAQERSAQTVTPGADVHLRRDPGLSAGVRAALTDLPQNVRLGVLVQDAGTGRVLESARADEAFIPASTMKLITAAAVLADRGGSRGWWSAALTVPAAQVGAPRVKAVTLRGSGDPTLSVQDGPYSLRALARQAYAHGLREVQEVRVADRTLNAGSWAGAVLGVPMTALRLSEWHEAPPGSAAQARARLGAALVAQLRAAGVKVKQDAVGETAPFRPFVPPARQDAQGRALPPDPLVPVNRRPEQAVASVRSGPVQAVLARTLRPSDNLLAEELLGTLAVQPAGNGTLRGALSRERTLLRQLGVDLSRVVLADGSGLSRENRLTPRALSHLLKINHDLPYLTVPVGEGRAALPGALYAARRNALAEAMPQAGTGENVAAHDGRGGTMALRLRGSGLDVRAKTGTLPGVSALAGYVTARSGRVLTFVLFMNGPQDTPILTLRAVQDRVVQALAESH